MELVLVPYFGFPREMSCIDTDRWELDQETSLKKREYLFDKAKIETR